MGCRAKGSPWGAHLLPGSVRRSADPDVEHSRVDSGVRLTCAAAVAVLAVALPSAQAQTARCDTRQVETLSVHVGPAPVRLRPGQVVPVRLEVVRADGSAAQTGAAAVTVGVSLTGASSGRRWGAYGDLVTGPDGTGTAQVAIPQGVRGAATLDVEVFRGLVALPCLQVEEHGHLTVAWGRVT